MIVLLAALSGATVWLASLAVARKDPVVAGQVASLAGIRARPRQFSPIRGGLAWLGRTYSGGAAESNHDLLAAAGRSEMPVEVFRGMQLVLAAGGFLGALATGASAIFLSPVGLLIGYRLPRTLLSSQVKRRRDEMVAALPDVVDLLAVCTHAGLNLSLSLRRVASRAPGPMGREIQRAVEEIELGIPRSQALQSLAARNGLPELDALVRVLSNSERFGSQIATSLESFSAEVRGSRKRAAEEHARKAPVKILFPLVFLILPAFVLLSVVPLLLSAFESLDF